EDDEIFEPAGHVEKSLGVEESEITRAQPAARHEHLLGRRRIVVVALHDARALHADLALDPRWALPGALVQRRQDAHGHTAARLAHREEATAGIELERHSARPDRDGQRGLGEAVARRDHALEPEVRLERLDRRQAYGLGARERGLEAREIEPGGVAHVAHAVA